MQRKTTKEAWRPKCAAPKLGYERKKNVAEWRNTGTALRDADTQGVRFRDLPVGPKRLGSM